MLISCLSCLSEILILAGSVVFVGKKCRLDPGLVNSEKIGSVQVESGNVERKLLNILIPISSIFHVEKSTKIEHNWSKKPAHKLWMVSLRTKWKPYWTPPALIPLERLSFRLNLWLGILLKNLRTLVRPIHHKAILGPEPTLPKNFILTASKHIVNVYDM